MTFGKFFIVMIVLVGFFSLGYFMGENDERRK
jgi:hypothetical protein